MSEKIVKNIIGDVWYTQELSDICDNLGDILPDLPWPIFKLISKRGLLRGLILYKYSRRYQKVILSSSYSGLFSFLVLEFIFNKQNRVVLLEFIKAEKPNHWIKKYFYPITQKYLITPIFRKTIKSIHVLSVDEIKRYAAQYQLPKSMFFYIPWPLRLKSDGVPDVYKINNKYSTVICSGRAACDWGTIFKAAENQYWNLIIICGKEDYKKVLKLNVNNTANVLCEISAEQHSQLVKDSSVYVLSLFEKFYSAGHVRLRECVRSGVPVIATDVKSLKGYIIPNKTGIMVPVGDSISMRNAVNSLLADSMQRHKLAKNAFEQAGIYFREDYIQKIRQLIQL